MTSSQTAPDTGLRAWTPAQKFAGVFGAVYLIVAIAGFAMTGLTGFGEGHDHTLVIFAVNPLHNYIHMVLAGGRPAARHRPRGEPRDRCRPGSGDGARALRRAGDARHVRHGRPRQLPA